MNQEVTACLVEDSVCFTVIHVVTVNQLAIKTTSAASVSVKCVCVYATI